MMLKCLIVDDEPPAHHVLESHIAQLTSLTLVGNCFNAIEAINFLHQHDVDILFLDINMPELSGMEMLKTLSDPPTVILTTAYSEFALEGYEYGVSDYLLKPIRFSRFLKAINRILDKRTSALSSSVSNLHKTEERPAQKKSLEKSFIFVKADGMQHKVHLKDLSYIESKGNYVQLHSTKRLMVAETLTSMDKNLRDHGFLRVHKSFVVNISKIKAIKGNRLIVGDEKIPIGNSYRQVVLNRIGV